MASKKALIGDVIEFSDDRVTPVEVVSPDGTTRTVLGGQFVVQEPGEFTIGGTKYVVSGADEPAQDATAAP